MLSVSSALFQTAPACSSMLQPTNRSLQMLKANRPLVGQANMASMPQMVIPDKQFRKVMGEMRRTNLEQRRKVAMLDGALETEDGKITAVEDKEQGEKRQAVYAKIFIRNRSDIDIVIAEHKDWSGTLHLCLPKNVEKYTDAIFDHVAYLNKPLGSMGGLLCYGKIEDMDLAWVIAWHAPQNDGMNNKLYARYGSKDDIMQDFDWDDVRKALEKATGRRVPPPDSQSGAYLFASIDQNDDDRPHLRVTLDAHLD